MTPQRQRLTWTVWAVLLVVSLVAVKWLNDRAVASAAADEGAGDGRFGFRLTESAKALGIDFTHQGPTFDARLDHIMPQVAAMGAAVAVIDFDRDGWLDLYVTNSGAHRSHLRHDVIEPGVECGALVREVHPERFRGLGEAEAEASVAGALIRRRRSHGAIVEHLDGNQRRHQHRRPGHPGDSFSVHA